MSPKPEKPRSSGAAVRELSARERIDLLGRVELARSRQAATERHAEPIIDLAAREYVAAIASKDRMRRAGYGGLQPDAVTLDRLARKHFPALDAAQLVPVVERIRHAAQELRPLSPATR